MPSTIEGAQQQVSFWKECIHEEEEREKNTAHPSVLMPRLQDGLSRSQEQLRKIQEK